MSSLGSKDHCLIAHRTIEYHLSQQLSHWKNVDPPPGHVKPIPFSIVQAGVENALKTAAPFPLAVANMSTIGFFYISVTLMNTRFQGSLVAVSPFACVM